MQEVGCNPLDCSYLDCNLDDCTQADCSQVDHKQIAEVDRPRSRSPDTLRRVVADSSRPCSRIVLSRARVAAVTSVANYCLR